MAAATETGVFRKLACAAEGPYRALGRVSIAGAVLLALIMTGSVAAPYEQLVHVIFAGLIVLFLPLPIRSRITGRVVLTSGLLVLFGAAWIVAQAQPGLLPTALTHPIWQDAARVGLGVTPSVSVNPAQTLVSLPQFVLPPLLFMTVLVLCQSRRAATGMWIGLSLVGLFVVLLSIVLEVAFPGMGFFSRYAVGFSTFSGVFVNRNIAASVFAVTAFTLAGTVYLFHVQTRARHLAQRIQDQSLWTPRSTGAALACFVAIIAIIATQSRAGALMALPILFLCLAVIQLQPRRAARRGMWIRAGAVLLAGAGLIVLLGEPIFARFETYGLADPRWHAWRGTWAAILDHPVAGTGFGAFQDTFPIYRDPESRWREAIWVHAHNGFLELALGLGIPAAVALITTGYAVLLGVARQGLRRQRSLRPIPILMLGILGFLTGHTLVDFPLQIPGVALYAAAVLGAGSAVCLAPRPARPQSSSVM